MSKKSMQPATRLGAKIARSARDTPYVDFSKHIKQNTDRHRFRIQKFDRCGKRGIASLLI
jgi:hypothetical protein